MMQGHSGVTHIMSNEFHSGDVHYGPDLLYVL